MNSRAGGLQLDSGCGSSNSTAVLGWRPVYHHCVLSLAWNQTTPGFVTCLSPCLILCLLKMGGGKMHAWRWEHPRDGAKCSSSSSSSTGSMAPPLLHLASSSCHHHQPRAALPVFPLHDRRRKGCRLHAPPPPPHEKIPHTCCASASFVLNIGRGAEPLYVGACAWHWPSDWLWMVVLLSRPGTQLGEGKYLWRGLSSWALKF